VIRALAGNVFVVDRDVRHVGVLRSSRHGHDRGSRFEGDFRDVGLVKAQDDAVATPPVQVGHILPHHARPTLETPGAVAATVPGDALEDAHLGLRLVRGEERHSGPGIMFFSDRTHVTFNGLTVLPEK